MLKICLRKSLIFIFSSFLAMGIFNSPQLFAKSKNSKEVAFIATTDYVAGSLASMDTTKKLNVSKNLLTIHQDSVVKSYAGKIYVVQRLGADSILVINPKAPGQTLTEYSTGNGSNPQDMEFKNSRKAYISLLGENNLLVVNPQNGNILKKIDLSEFADGDGIVEMSEMVMVNNYLYVSLQRLENFSAENTSLVVVIDTKTDKIIDLDSSTPGNQAIELKGRNPVNMVYNVETGKIYLSLSGKYNTADDFGGIEVINPETNTSEGILIKDEDLGGVPGPLAIKSSKLGYVAVSDENYIYSVIPFNPSTGKIFKKLNDTGSGYIPVIAIDSKGFLYVADQTPENPGIRIFNTKKNKLVKGPIDVGLLPFSITFVKN